MTPGGSCACSRVAVLAAVGLINRAGTMVVPFLVLYLTRHLGFRPGQAGALFALYGVGAVVASPSVIAGGPRGSWRAKATSA